MRAHVFSGSRSNHIAVKWGIPWSDSAQDQNNVSFINIAFISQDNFLKPFFKTLKDSKDFTGPQETNHIFSSDVDP